MLSRSTILYVSLVCAYYLVGGAFIAMFHPDPWNAANRLIETAPAAMFLFVKLAQWSLPVLIAVLFFAARSNIPGKIADILVVLLANAAFGTMFLTLKSTLPYIIPFYADPMMANLDVVLHGTDPYRYLFDWLGGFPVQIWKVIYTDIWLVPTFFFPIWLTMFDFDQARVRKFMILHAFTWVILGNVVAALFMSAGPVFYDALLGGDRFADLTRMMTDTGITDSAVGQAAASLWSSYSQGAISATSGISAFPSVHVGMATVVSLYLAERFRILTLPAILVVVTYQILSVLLGWHYAVDGYASILGVGLAWFALSRRAKSVQLQDNVA